MGDNRWVEWNGSRPEQEDWMTLKAMLGQLGIYMWHYFLDEPVAPWVVRAYTDAERLPTLGEGAWREVTMGEDAEAFGELYPKILSLFAAASEIGLELALGGKPGQMAGAGKLIHCLLNTWGYARDDEIALHESQIRFDSVIAALEKTGRFSELWPEVARNLIPAARRGRLSF